MGYRMLRGDFLEANRLAVARPGSAALDLLDGDLCGPWDAGCFLLSGWPGLMSNES